MTASKHDSIKHLTPEIIWDILDILGDDRSGLASCATISPVWQHAVESRSFASIRLESTASVSAFRDAFASRTHRRAYLRDLRLDLHLPMRCASKQGRVKNQLIFRQAVRLLLDVLSEWGSIGDGEPNNLSLAIKPLYDSVGCYDDQYNKSSLRKVDFGPSKSLLDRKFLALWSEGESVELSQMPCVKRFNASNSEVFVLSPTTLCAISGAFTSLEQLSLDFCDPAPKYRGFRFKHRKGFANGLESLCGKLPCLKRLTIQQTPADGYPITNHSFRCQDLTDDQGVDLLCEAIRKLAQPTVTHLAMEGLGVSPDLFSNQRPHAASTEHEDTWHSLQRLYLRVDWTAPNGTWYITGPEEESNNRQATAEPNLTSRTKGDAVDDWCAGDGRKAYIANGQQYNLWRTKMHADTLEPLLSAMADAFLHRLPRLQSSMLQMPEYGYPSAFFCECAAAGQWLPTERRWDKLPERPSRRRWSIKLYEVGDWHASAELRAKWEEWVGETGTVEYDYGEGSDE